MLTGGIFAIVKESIFVDVWGLYFWGLDFVGDFEVWGVVVFADWLICLLLFLYSFLLEVRSGGSGFSYEYTPLYSLHIAIYMLISMDL